jgi:hypothetical protein
LLTTLAIPCGNPRFLGNGAASRATPFDGSGQSVDEALLASQRRNVPIVFEW